MVVAFECSFRPKVRQERKAIQALFSFLISEVAELGGRGEMGGVSCPWLRTSKHYRNTHMAQGGQSNFLLVNFLLPHLQRATPGSLHSRRGQLSSIPPIWSVMKQRRPFSPQLF